MFQANPKTPGDLIVAFILKVVCCIILLVVGAAILGSDSIVVRGAAGLLLLFCFVSLMLDFWNYSRGGSRV